MEGWLFLGALPCVACSGVSTPDLRNPRPRTRAETASCEIEVRAKWDAPVVVVDVTPLWGSGIVADDATLLGGKILATFGEAGIPSYMVQPDPGAGRITMNLPVDCDHKASMVRLRLDIPGDRIKSPILPVELDPVPPSVSVRLPGAK